MHNLLLLMFVTEWKISMIKAIRGVTEMPLKTAKDTLENGMIIQASEVGIFLSELATIWKTMSGPNATYKVEVAPYGLPVGPVFYTMKPETLGEHINKVFSTAGAMAGKMTGN